MIIIKRGVSSLFAVLIPLVAFAPLAGSAGPILGSAQRAVHQTGTLARQAQSHASRPATFLTGWPFTSNLASEDLGALTLTPGYSSSSSAETLDAKGNADSAFQIGKTLDIASDRTVRMVKSDAGDEVHWDVGSSAPFGTNKLFAEHILADRGIALDTIAWILCGRAIAPKARSKLDANAISDDCTAINGERSGPTELANLVSQNHNVPEPSTGLLLVAVGLIGVGAGMKGTFT